MEILHIYISPDHSFAGRFGKEPLDAVIEYWVCPEAVNVPLDAVIPLVSVALMPNKPPVVVIDDALIISPAAVVMVSAPVIVSPTLRTRAPSVPTTPVRLEPLP